MSWEPYQGTRRIHTHLLYMEDWSIVARRCRQNEVKFSATVAAGAIPGC